MAYRYRNPLYIRYENGRGAFTVAAFRVSMNEYHEI
jgi:hypothetical protein